MGNDVNKYSMKKIKVFFRAGYNLTAEQTVMVWEKQDLKEMISETNTSPR